MSSFTQISRASRSLKIRRCSRQKCAIFIFHLTQFIYYNFNSSRDRNQVFLSGKTSDFHLNFYTDVDPTRIQREERNSNRKSARLENFFFCRLEGENAEVRKPRQQKWVAIRKSLLREYTVIRHQKVSGFGDLSYKGYWLPVGFRERDGRLGETGAVGGFRLGIA